MDKSGLRSPGTPRPQLSLEPLPLRLGLGRHGFVPLKKSSEANLSWPHSYRLLSHLSYRPHFPPRKLG
jgi:hypothetical protein